MLAPLASRNEQDLGVGKSKLQLSLGKRELHSCGARWATCSSYREVGKVHNSTPPASATGGIDRR